jgi:hypothetical protein
MQAKFRPERDNEHEHERVTDTGMDPRHRHMHRHHEQWSNTLKVKLIRDFRQPRR